jgi:hypothetical protein
MIKTEIRKEYPVTVLTNEIAGVCYSEKTQTYIAYDKRCFDDCFTNEVCRTVKGDFKKCKKAYDNYTFAKVDSKNRLLKKEGSTTKC